MICIHFGSNHKALAFGLWNVGTELLHTIQVPKLTGCPVLCVKLGFINHWIAGVIDDLSVVILLEVREDVKHLLQMPLPWQHQVGGQHGNLKTNVNPSQLHNPSQDSNERLEIGSFLGTQFGCDIKLWSVGGSQGSVSLIWRLQPPTFDLGKKILHILNCSSHILIRTEGPSLDSVVQFNQIQMASKVQLGRSNRLLLELEIHAAEDSLGQPTKVLATAGRTPTTT
jgi:hypothetical protein